MTIFFTADQHFGHANILKYEDENRRNSHGGRFSSIEKMDEFLVDQWNNTVTPGDLVYCLGDFSYKQTIMEAILPCMNGTKILVVGNHDPYFKRLTMPLKTKMHREAHEAAYQAGFQSIHLQLDIEISGIGLVRMSHFPYWPKNPEMEEEYNLRNQESRPPVGREKVLLHGHIHSEWCAKKEDKLPIQINVGVDMWRMRPVSENELVQLYQQEKLCCL